VATLGREYYSINYTQIAQANIADAYSYFFVVATEDNTTVEIIPSAPTVGGKLGGQAFTETLNKGEIYQVLSRADLTGSSIKSVNTGAGCKKIAVFSGSGRIGIGCGTSVSSSDNLFQQVYPNSTWGKKYITVPSLDRPKNYFRIIRPDATATVRLNGSILPPTSFTNNFFYEFDATTPNVIESDKPVQVAQYFTTQGCAPGTPNGDPEMIYLNPVEQTISDVTLTSMVLINPQNNKHYLNVVLPNIPTAINTFKIDGIPVGGFTPVPADARYVYLQYPTTLGTHRITCDSGFNAIAYGFGNAESYGYSAGTNLRDLYQFIQVKNQFSSVNIPTACNNRSFKLSIVFPYQVSRIEWQFGGVLPDVTLVSPVFDSTWVVNGRILFRYSIDRLNSINVAGTYPIKVIADNTTTDGCSGKQEIFYDLQIVTPPQADFQFQTTGCSSDSVFFNDISSTLNTRSIVDWRWTLGGLAESQKKSFNYKFPDGGKYLVKMQVIDNIGCISEPAAKEVELENIPIPLFEHTTACKDAGVTFTDRSNNNGATIAKWRWDFGDGTRDSTTVAGPINHVYTKTGTFPVTLTLVNSKGCVSNSFKKDVVVNQLPIAGFILPEVCLNDAFAEFIDTSKSPDGSTMTYQWDFADGSTSTDKSPKHKFNAAKVYNIQQVVTTSLGCIDTTLVAFTVNGALPSAQMQIKNTGPLCSDRLVELVNNSTVDFGKVTRLEIFWDFTNNPNTKFTDDDPASGEVYQYIYPSFGSPAIKKMKVKMVVYSGLLCKSEIVQDLDLLASPQLAFTPITPVCGNVDPFQITQASETSGLSGTFRFEGNGIDAKGLFNPATAGRGSHTISYIFSSTAGCIDTISSVMVVKEVPKADAGPDRAVLSGGYVVLNATASGTNISVNWTPPTDLDNATIIKPKASPSADITYSLTVTTAEGCSVSDEVFVKFLNDIKIPNTFTPNGDGYNDRWEILSLDSYPGSLLEVYSTAGQLIYRTQGYAKPWDGTNNGKPLPAGTYYYVIDPKNGRKKIAGYVTLIR
jgi:gliding motility-associated-like protein